MSEREGERKRPKQSKRTKQQKDKVIGLIRRDGDLVASLQATVLSNSLSCQKREGVNDRGEVDNRRKIRTGINVLL